MSAQSLEPVSRISNLSENDTYVKYSEKIVKPEIKTVLWHVRDLITRAQEGNFNVRMIPLSSIPKQEAAFQIIKDSGREISDLTDDELEDFGIPVTYEEIKNLRPVDIAGLSEAIGRNIRIMQWEFGDVISYIPELAEIAKMLAYFVSERNQDLPDEPQAYFATEYGKSLLSFAKQLEKLLSEDE